MPPTAKRTISSPKSFKSKKTNFRHWLMILPFILLLVGLAAAAFLLSTNSDLRQQAAGVAYIACKTSSQCPSGATCQPNGICSTPTACKMFSGNCPSGQFCDFGKDGKPVCLVGSGCSAKKPCPAGTTCDYTVGQLEGDGGTCRTALGNCNDKTPCPVGQSCASGACVRPFGCASGCKSGEVCDTSVAGKCVKPLSLCKNNVCPTGQECVAGGCLYKEVCTPGVCSRPTPVPVTKINTKIKSRR